MLDERAQSYIISSFLHFLAYKRKKNTETETKGGTDRRKYIKTDIPRGKKIDRQKHKKR